MNIFNSPNAKPLNNPSMTKRDKNGVFEFKKKRYIVIILINEVI